MLKDNLKKIEDIRDRINRVQQCINPIQRRYSWLKKKLEIDENPFLRAELEALSLCWFLIREEVKRLKVFNSYLLNKGDRDGSH